MGRFSWVSLSLVACGVASGCAPSAASNLPPGVSVAPDGIGFCCQAGTPSCECRGTGGHVDRADQCGSTGRVCDAHPDLWQSATDAHGCNYYTVAMWTPGSSGCNPRRDTGTSRRPDVGVDAALDDAPIDDAPVDAVPWPDVNLDVGVLPENVTPAPDGMGFCCEADIPSCGCQFFGAHADTASECDALRAIRTCDVHPNDWMPVTDVHGCSFYVPPRFGVPGRSCFGDAGRR